MPITPLNWNELKRSYESIFVPEINVKLRATPASPDEPDSPMSRYWLTVNDEIMWDFPFAYPQFTNCQTFVIMKSPQIAVLLTEYLAVNITDLLTKRFTNDTITGLGYRAYGNVSQPIENIQLGLTEILLACDKRIDTELLSKHPLVIRSEKAARILYLRANIEAYTPKEESEEIETPQINEPTTEEQPQETQHEIPQETTEPVKPIKEEFFPDF
jgi:hypothetical protein